MIELPDRCGDCWQIRHGIYKYGVYHTAIFMLLNGWFDRLHQTKNLSVFFEGGRRWVAGWLANSSSMLLSLR